MTDSLLLSIRNGLIEGRPLPDLLRACIFLGSDANSQPLQDWARKELEGYDDDDVPEYRRLPNPPVFATVQAGYQVMSNVVLGPRNVPKKAQKFFPEHLKFLQPIQALIDWSEQDNAVSFMPGGLFIVRDLHNNEHAPFNQILEISIKIDKSYISGMLDRVRTLMTSMIADLTQDNPMRELPNEDKVNSIVNKYIENNYETAIERSTGPLAIGTKASAVQSGLNVDEIIALIQSLDLSRYELTGEERAAAEAELTRVTEELQSDKPHKGMLRRAADKLKELGKTASDRVFTAYMEGLGSSLAETVAQLP